MKRFGSVDYAQATTQRKAHDFKLTERRSEFQIGNSKNQEESDLGSSLFAFLGMEFRD